MSGCGWNSVLCLYFLVTSTLFHDTILDSDLAKFIEHCIATLLIQASHLHLQFFVLTPWSYLIPLYRKVLKKEISWKGEYHVFLFFGAIYFSENSLIKIEQTMHCTVLWRINRFFALLVWVVVRRSIISHLIPWIHFVFLPCIILALYLL